MNDALRLQQFEKQIQEIKLQLLALGDLRPGSLSQQYNVCGKAGCRCKAPQKPKRHGPYYQLSYVHRGKSTSQFIRTGMVKTVKVQIARYKTFRKLTEQWLDLAVRIAKLKLAAAKKNNHSN
jgi:ribosomal protein L29